MHLIALAIGIVLQAPIPARIAILSECDPAADIVAQTSPDSTIQVHYSIAGSPTCYSVTAVIDGKAVRGFVLDRQADAVVAFEKARVETEQTAFKAPLPQPSSAPAALDPPKTAAVAAKAPVEKKPLPKAPKVDM